MKLIKVNGGCGGVLSYNLLVFGLTKPKVLQAYFTDYRIVSLGREHSP